MREMLGCCAQAVRGRKMWLTLLQTLACGLPLGGCGGGGSSTEPESAAAAAPAVLASAAAASTVSSPAATPAPAHMAAGLAISFTLAETRSTSAGVYAADGTLVRTLWRGERLASGTYTRTWDQRSDSGAELADGEYTVKVAHHDVKYTWEGVVGNSASQAGSAAPHRAFQVPAGLAFNNGHMHVAVGYNEAQNGILGFDAGNPQLSRSAVQLVDPFVGATLVAADADRLYWANTGGLTKKSFVAAFDLVTGAQWAFSAGTAVCLNTMPDTDTCYPAQRYKSVLEWRANMDSPPTGLAVQRNGRILAVAYGADNAVRLYDKHSGELLRVLAVSLNAKTSNALAMTPRGDLWVIAGNSALRYTALDTQPEVAATVTALSKPLALAVDPQDDDTVWVADGGTSQQLKRFDSAGNARQTAGRLGGHNGTAGVAADRLCFQRAPGDEQTAIAVDMSHAVWVVDTCNNRLLKLAAGGSVAEQVAYQPASYVSAVDNGNPTRVFSNFLEFEVDYSKGLVSPQSWKLVRNWLPGLPAALQDADSTNRAWGGFRTVQTLSNGRTYGLMKVGSQPMLVELAANGQVRAIRAMPANAAGETAPVLYENGDLGYAANSNTHQAVMRRALEGFDASGNPVWAAKPTTIAAAPLGLHAPYQRIGTFSGVQAPRFPVTSSGKVVFFNPSVAADSGFHLGAVAQGTSAWQWQASPSGPMDGRGSFQTRKDDPALQYGGNAVHALGRSIVYGYHGEFYTDLGNRRVGQANQFMHFRDDGLFIGQFGVPSTRATSPTQPGLSGNAFSSTLVRANGRVYLYHNDESSHGGVHRWRLEGFDDVAELVGTAPLRSKVTLR